ncbi:methionine adenosyltransferase 2 subunit beta [Lontra canadensis]|uniref:methionine adenosyltransferase 2 subunit beta n=1 Tax=Lontra canadensis TaxID=76717 RepID=UPI0013F3006E|nr:methionine adenosyltransferase 2 subunit beta [Lontra canadensis]
MVGRENELSIHFVPGSCRLVEVRESARGSRRNRECRGGRARSRGLESLVGEGGATEFVYLRAHPSVFALPVLRQEAKEKIEVYRMSLRPSSFNTSMFTFQPHVIVHCAAERRPDVVENQPDAASQLNVNASGNLAKEAALIGAFLIYISSDYVFDGTNPPYREEDVPSPLNLYGKTKLEGEKAVLENNLGAAVLRIPVLYGEVEKLEESAVTVMFDKVQFSNKSANMDHWQQRFPTHVKDVATVCRQLAEKRMLDPSIKGTFHWSGNEQMTKYEMACAIADAFNLPSSHLRPITDSPVLGAQRPRNAQLDCTKLETLGIGQRTPFRIGIKESLWPFLIDKRWRQTVFH